jgi:hypothetical protein
MKNLLMVANGGHLAARTVKAALVVLTTLALAAMFWIASTSIVHAQDLSPAKMIESQLPQGSAVETAGKADFLAAVCAAVKKYRTSAPAIAAFAGNAHPDWKKDILRSAFGCLGTDDCRLLARVLKALSAGSDASELADLALELAPNCAPAFGGGQPDEGDFGNPPGNQNPPPGSIGGGGGQGNVIAICHNGMTIFVSPQGAENHLRNHPGDTLGPCVVTAVTNQ